MTKQYESEVLASVHEAALGLSEAGVMSKRRMRKFDEMCLTSVEDATPEEENSRPTLKLGPVTAAG